MTNDEKRRFRFAVNGTVFEAGERAELGRDLLQIAGCEPANEFVLIEITRPGSRSVGLDEEVNLAEGGQKEYRAFRADRAFMFVAIERGYEWGSPTIAEEDLRDITGTTDEDVLVLVRPGQPDTELEPGMQVDLSSIGTEHIAKRRRRITIIVNARPEMVETDMLTYAQLLALAFHPVPIGPEVAFTITYRNGPAENSKGTLPEGASVAIKNGMIFNVTQTNRS